MFLDSLSSSVLLLCNFRNLSYEMASELCDISPKYFGQIARRQTMPTIKTLEKLCIGFELTPNDLLLPIEAQQEIWYRTPLPVSEVRCHRELHGFSGFPVCPRCDTSLEREYQAYCDRCGQFLSWEDYPKATIILPTK